MRMLRTQCYLIPRFEIGKVFVQVDIFPEIGRVTDQIDIVGNILYLDIKYGGQVKWLK